MTKKAKELTMGDRVFVDMGKGVSVKIVDKVSNDQNKNIVVTLYRETGRWPTMTLSPNHIVRVMEPTEA